MYRREKNMREYMRLIVAVSGLVALPFAFAAETPIDIKTDVKGKYYVVEKAGTPNNPILVVKRVGPNVNQYIKRQFDCKERTVTFLGEGETLQEMAKAKPDPKPAPLVEGSIPDQLARYACPK
jgi:hypothetical protein